MVNVTPAKEAEEGIRWTPGYGKRTEDTPEVLAGSRFALKLMKMKLSNTPLAWVPSKGRGRREHPL